MGASLWGGRLTYPVNCFCAGKMVVQVPTGGDLKRITMSASTGDRTVVTPSAKALDEGYCPATGAQYRRVVSKRERHEAARRCYLESAAVATQCDFLTMMESCTTGLSNYPDVRTLAAEGWTRYVG